MNRFSKKTGQSFEIYQLYRTLSLSPAFIPTRFCWHFVAQRGDHRRNRWRCLLAVAAHFRTDCGFGEGTQEIGRGNLDYQIPQRSTDELSELVQYFTATGG